MNAKRVISTIIFTVLAAVMFASCSSKSAQQDYDNSIADSGGAVIMPQSEARKIIYTANITLETEDFAKTLNSVKAKVLAYRDLNEGYFDSEDISSSAYLVVRIKSEKLSEFIESLYGDGKIIQRRISSEDITNNYIDIEARLNSLEIELARWEEMMETAYGNDIIMISDRITDILRRIEEYNLKLNAYDKQVEFSTVYLNIYNTGKAPVTEKYSTKLEKAFFGSLNALLEFFKFLLIAIVAVMPFAVLGGGAFFAVKGIRSRIKKKHPEKYKTGRDIKDNRTNNGKD